MTLPFRFSAPCLSFAVVASIAMTSPALAGGAPTTRLVSCPAGSCLVVAGRRDSPQAVVTINEHAVSVDGSRKWQVLLPVATVRDWSEPQARAITVATYDPATGLRSERDADLPIGLLGHVELASLVVAVR